MSLALRITTAAGSNEGTSKTISFEMSLSVYQACQIIREKITDPTNEGICDARHACHVVLVWCCNYAVRGAARALLSRLFFACHL